MNQVKQDGRDDWDVIPAAYADYTLEELIRAGEPEGAQGPYDRLTVRLVPVGFPLVIRRIARRNRISCAALQRIMLRHGLSLIREDSRTGAMMAERTRLDEALLNTSNTEDFDRVGELNKLQPSDTREHQLTLSCYGWAHEALADLAQDMMLYLSSTAVLACILSLDTLGGAGAFWGNVRRDTERFWSLVEQRAGYFASMIEGLPS